MSYSQKLKSLRKRLKGRRSNLSCASSRTAPPMYPILPPLAQSRSSRWPGNRLLTLSALSASDFWPVFIKQSDELGGYGQGAAGYGRRFGALYGDVFFGTFYRRRDSAIIAEAGSSLLLKGTGTTRERFFYALRNAVVCGETTSGGSRITRQLLSNTRNWALLVLSSQRSRGASLLVETAPVEIAEGGVAGIFQEFVIPHPNAASEEPPSAAPVMHVVEGPTLLRNQVTRSGHRTSHH